MAGNTIFFKKYYFYFGDAGELHIRVPVLTSEDNVKDLVLIFHYMSPGDQTQVIRMGRKHPYLPSHLDSPDVILFLSIFNSWLVGPTGVAM